MQLYGEEYVEVQKMKLDQINWESVTANPTKVSHSTTATSNSPKYKTIYK